MRKLKGRIKRLVILAVLLCNIGCDQITKHIATNHINDGENISVVSSFLTLTKVENSGAFLSLGSSLPATFKILLLMILPTLVLIGLLVFILRNRKIDLKYALPIAFIIGGGMGNLYDRIFFGSVTDFLHLNFQLFQTGIFNMADVSIMIGSLWLLLIQLKTRRDKQASTV
ncbi:MAG: signal peptidase II [Bacteroidota bacterium]